MFETLENILKRYDQNFDRTAVDFLYPESNGFQKHIIRKKREADFGYGIERRYRLWIPFNDFPRKIKNAKDDGGGLGNYSIAVGAELAENIVRFGCFYVLYKVADTLFSKL